MQAFIPTAPKLAPYRHPSLLKRSSVCNVRAQQSPDQTPNSDWRSFRAKLVQAETNKKRAKTEEWAHEVSFVEAGCLLIASPEHFVGEHACSFFANSVVLVLSHGRREGTIGVILNRPVGQAVSEPRLRAALDGTPVPLYLGGPVALDSLLAVHDQEKLPGAMRVVDGIATSGVGEVLKRVEGGNMGRERCRLFCGYSGWAGGQLQQEIDEGVWYTCACCTDIIMSRGAEEGVVKKLLRLMGGRFTEIGERLDDKEGERSYEI